MPLPILNIPTQASAEDLARYFDRTSLLRAEQIAEATQLDVGVALTNPHLQLKHDANHVRQAALPAGVLPAEAVEMVDAHFNSVGARCFYWVMNPSAANEQVQPLRDHLIATGWQANRSLIMHLRQSGKLPAREAGLTIIPARASFRHFKALAEESELVWGKESLSDLVAAKLLRLDDSHWDCLMAMKDGVAIATAGVFSAGDVGRIEDVYVSERFRGLGIGQAMMSRALEICARSLFKHVLLEVDPENQPAIAVYEKCGFQNIGQTVSYRRNS